MSNRFASGKKAIAECDRCGQQYRLSKLKTEIIKTKKYELLVCPECWDPDLRDNSGYQLAKSALLDRARNQQARPYEKFAELFQQEMTYE